MVAASSLVSSKTFTLILGTTAVVGAIVTTCVKLDLDRRRFKHDTKVALLLEQERRNVMELERLKFEHEKERFEFEREKFGIRRTALSKSARLRAEHAVLKISKRTGFTHVDASEFVQSIWDECLAIETTEDFDDHNRRH